VVCQPIGLMEQIEDGEVDHKILAIPIGEQGVVSDGLIATLRDFVEHVFEHVPGKIVSAGAIRGAMEAEKYVRDHS